MRKASKQSGLGSSRRLQLYIIGVGVWLSGLLWLVFHYFLVRQGEFGPTSNPLEPWWLKVHGAFAFAALWLFGLLWGVHIAKLWKSKQRRWSGGILTATLAVLVLTGYLLYYVGDERARPVISVVHWVIGLVCPVFFLWHRLRQRKRRVSALRAPGL